MTTLDAPPISSLLDRLFAEADAAEQLMPDDMPQADRSDYLAFYAPMKDQPLLVSRETGTLLYMLARSMRAQTIVEFGTSFGVSTIDLAAALRDNGGGRLIGSEFEPSKIARARANLAEANLADLVEIRQGDALKTFLRDLPGSIDMVLLDGAKNLYSPVLSLLEKHLRVGALIIADNADMSPEYLARVRSAGPSYLSVPFSGDVEVSMKI